MPETVSALSLLRDRSFRTLWSTVELSLLGFFMPVVACGWLMTTLTTSTTMVALIQTAVSLPMVLFSVVAGALADTLDRRRTMLASLGLSFAASAALAVAAWAGWLTPWSMLALLFFVGSGLAVMMPSWHASLGDIAPLSRLAEAVSLHNMGANIMRTVGPTVGGLLFGVAGAALTFLAGALTYLPAWVAVLAWRPTGREGTTDPERLAAAVGSGIRYLFAAPDLQPILLRVLAFCIGTSSVLALLPLTAKDQLGGGAQSYGLLMGGYGMGAILAGLMLAELRRRYATESLLRATALANAGAVMLLALGDRLWMGLGATVLAGSCWLVNQTLFNSTLQLATPRWMIGRMVAMYLTATFLGLSVGSWLWGALAEITGTLGSLALSSAALFGTYLMALRLPLPETSADPQQLDPASEARLSPGVEGHDGPIQVLIEYRIGAEELPEFLRLMDERRRQIMRLGARRWALMRDSDMPERWTESFRSDNRGDYRRLMRRRSAENLGLRQRLWSLHRGEEAPVVRLMLEKVRDQAPIEPMLRA